MHQSDLLQAMQKPQLKQRLERHQSELNDHHIYRQHRNAMIQVEHDHKVHQILDSGEEQRMPHMLKLQ
eukprot:CAMPEP_0197339088 /NCGR_PEP_ID=MMETSP0892-20130614/42737_1 /TAXON_ID=44058 ORGANISM="Aureoumbra lagunensis, Strain CCMP1510" /NCGR_SAMPLE_ID=MMETSP0892 /ASSEMBLY_ACC=CAM_ASM_000538 /LENGTH=67 /DNA_ID=CAMNT_0042843001 /DNA_START=674 /DNA_END=877 /DNA_ORIENTATION=+